MMPSAFVLLEALPLTPNGKLDRKALPSPEYGVATKQLVPAQTLDESRLILLWQALLGVQPIGVEDNFFALGGHSLLATQLVHRMRETLQRPVSLQQLFQTPTIRTLLQGMTEVQSALTAFVPLRKVEQQGNLSQAPLFLLPPAGGMALPYTTLLPYLAATQPVYAYQARGIYDDLPPFASIEEMATTVRQEMKQIQPQGPYRLGGWSFGGMVAFAVACQLRQQGEQVEFLGVMDAYPPTDAPAAVAEELSTQAELEGFFYLLGDIMGVDYHRLDAELFADATQQTEPVAWLLDQLRERGMPLALEPTLVKRIWTTLKQNGRLMQAYQPPCYDGAITLFCAEASAPADGAARWQALTPQPVETVWVKGEHNTMLNASLVEKLGRELAKRLQAVHGG